MTIIMSDEIKKNIQITLQYIMFNTGISDNKQSIE